MFEKDILSSLKLMLDHAKGDRKISSEVNCEGYSPKRARDIMAPRYEDAINITFKSEDRGSPMVSFQFLLS